MKHEISVEGHAFRLRPVRRADAEFIVALRRERAMYINRGASTKAEQEEWLDQYMTRTGDYFFVAEDKFAGLPHGLIAIYNVNESGGDGEWGRFVVKDGSPAAIETAMLVFGCGIEVLGLKRIYGRTLLENEKVVAFHDSCGLLRMRDKVVIIHNGVPRPGVEHELNPTLWPQVKERLDQLARRIALAIRS
jgi:RimJ/RimL family protein N-acetyltransferase